MTRSPLFFIAVLFAASLPAAGQHTQKLGVPAFFPVTYCNGVHNGDWDRLQAAASEVDVVVADKTTLCDPTNIASTAAQFDRLRANHVFVFGYVDTQSGRRPFNNVFYGGDTASPRNPTSVSDWFRDYAGHFDGIFFDDGPDNTANDTNLYLYYASLYSNFNQGTPFHLCAGHACLVMLNASQYPNEWVDSVSDRTITYERALHAPDGQDYLTNFIPTDAQMSPPGWEKNYGATGNFERVVYGVGTNDVNNVICHSRQYGTPMLYLHNQSTASYGQLSTLFEQTVNFVNGYQFCADPSTAYCGTQSYDPCGTFLPGCQQGLWCPSGYSCQDAGGYLDCLPW